MNFHKESSKFIGTFGFIVSTIAWQIAASYPKAFCIASRRFTTEELKKKGNFHKDAMEILAVTTPETQREYCIRFAANHPKYFLKIVKPELFEKPVPQPLDPMNSSKPVPQPLAPMNSFVDGDGLIVLRFNWNSMYDAPAYSIGVPSARITKEVFDKCIQIATLGKKTGCKLQAIKDIRNASSIGLREAKAFYENVEAGTL